MPVQLVKAKKPPIAGGDVVDADDEEDAGQSPPPVAELQQTLSPRGGCGAAARRRAPGQDHALGLGGGDCRRLGMWCSSRPRHPRSGCGSAARVRASRAADALSCPRPHPCSAAPGRCWSDRSAVPGRPPAAPRRPRGWARRCSAAACTSSPRAGRRPASRSCSLRSRFLYAEIGSTPDSLVVALLRVGRRQPVDELRARPPCSSTAR